MAQDYKRNRILDEFIRQTGIERRAAQTLLEKNHWKTDEAHRMFNTQKMRDAPPVSGLGPGSGSGHGVAVSQQRGGGGHVTQQPVLNNARFNNAAAGIKTGGTMQVIPTGPILQAPVTQLMKPVSNIEAGQRLNQEKCSAVQTKSQGNQAVVTPGQKGGSTPTVRTHGEGKPQGSPKIVRNIPIQIQSHSDTSAGKRDIQEVAMPNKAMPSNRVPPMTGGLGRQECVPNKPPLLRDKAIILNSTADQPVTTSHRPGDPKLKRGISNTLENASLVSTVRGDVLQDIEESIHDHMHVQTFILPDLTIYSTDFRAFLEKDLIETSTLVSLEQAGRLNWWAEMGLCQRLLPMATTGDGNCLLHAASLAMWGFHDRDLILRKALYDCLTEDTYSNELYRRWRWQQTQVNKESGLIYSEDEWKMEWEGLLRLASPKPRTNPEAMTQTGCCGSPVTSSSNSGCSVVYESLEEFHVFVLAHVLKRTIIVVSDTVLRDVGGEALAPIPFGGIYLPLECDLKCCLHSPLLLTYDAAHFSALVPMDQDLSSAEKSNIPVAIPLVDPHLVVLPLHFVVDPGETFDWTKNDNEMKPDLALEDKKNLLRKYLDVEQLPIPRLDNEMDSDHKSTGSCDSDESAGCIGKDRGKDRKVSQQMHTVAKQFGSIGKNMGKKLKKNFGNLGKAMRNIRGENGEKNGRRLSVGGDVIQTTKPTITPAALLERDRVISARLAMKRSLLQEKLVENYLQEAHKRFEIDRDLKRQRAEEMAARKNVGALYNKVPVKCVSPGCNMYGTASSSYLCSKCFDQQKQQAIDHELQSGTKYNTFPGHTRRIEEPVQECGKSKFYTAMGGKTLVQHEQNPESAVGHGSVGPADASTNPRGRSLLAVDKTSELSSSTPIMTRPRTPSPDYDNVDYTQYKREKVAKLPQVINAETVTCITNGCTFFGSEKTEFLCSSCYKQKQKTLLHQSAKCTKL